MAIRGLNYFSIGGPGAGSDRKKKVTLVSRYHHLISLIKNSLEVSCETHVVVDFQLVIFREGASFMSKITDYGRPMKPFFIEIQNFWAWPTIWADEFLGIWGILADL